MNKILTTDNFFWSEIKIFCNCDQKKKSPLVNVPVLWENISYKYFMFSLLFCHKKEWWDTFK